MVYRYIFFKSLAPHRTLALCTYKDGLFNRQINETMPVERHFDFILIIFNGVTTSAPIFKYSWIFFCVGTCYQARVWGIKIREETGRCLLIEKQKQKTLEIKQISVESRLIYQKWNRLKDNMYCIRWVTFARTSPFLRIRFPFPLKPLA